MSNLPVVCGLLDFDCGKQRVVATARSKNDNGADTSDEGSDDEDDGLYGGRAGKLSPMSR